MIQDFITRYQANENQLRSFFAEKHPDSYYELVKAVVNVISTEDYADMDAERIHEIDDGNYQGTLIYIIAENGYQPSEYWYVKVGYGSCSGCDAIESIRSYSDEKPTKEQIDEYMQLSLHIAQGLKKMGGPDDE